MSAYPYPHAGRIRPVTHEQYAKLTRQGRLGVPRKRPSFIQRLVRAPSGTLWRVSDGPTCLW
jgi:hypothetical protein